MKEITRRRFLIGLGATAATVATGEIIRSGIIPYIEKARETPESILADIYRRYKIKIPLPSETEYAIDNLRHTVKGNIENTGMQLESKSIATLALEEARLFREGIEKVPGASSLLQVILPYRFFAPDEETKMFEVPQAAYQGREWRGDKLYCFESESFSTAKLDKKAGISFFLPLDFSPNKPLINPDVYQYTFPMVPDPVESDELPLKTQKDAFFKVLTHEFGHAFEDQVKIRASSTIEEYCKRRPLTLCGFNSIDKENPIFKTFAKISGWQLVPLSEISAMCGLDISGIEREEETFGWIRDPAVWGERPEMRISNRATHGPIDEVFAEFFMVSILYPEFLNDKERRYFGKIHKGLAGDAEKFLDEVAKNPEILLG